MKEQWKEQEKEENKKESVSMKRETEATFSKKAGNVSILRGNVDTESVALSGILF